MEIFTYFMKCQEIWKFLSMALGFVSSLKACRVILKFDFVHFIRIFIEFLIDPYHEPLLWFMIIFANTSELLHIYINLLFY